MHATLPFRTKSAWGCGTLPAVLLVLYDTSRVTARVRDQVSTTPASRSLKPIAGCLHRHTAWKPSKKKKGELILRALTKRNHRTSLFRTDPRAESTFKQHLDPQLSRIRPAIITMPLRPHDRASLRIVHSLPSHTRPARAAEIPISTREPAWSCKIIHVSDDLLLVSVGSRRRKCTYQDSNSHK